MASQGSLKFLLAFLIILAAGNLAWTKFLRAKPAPWMDDLQYGVYLQGNDIHNEAAADANSEERCLKVCLQDTRCKAMSFVENPWGGGVCLIKDKVPARVPANNAISAVKHFPW